MTERWVRVWGGSATLEIVGLRWVLGYLASVDVPPETVVPSHHEWHADGRILIEAVALTRGEVTRELERIRRTYLLDEETGWRRDPQGGWL